MHECMDKSRHVLLFTEIKSILTLKVNLRLIATAFSITMPSQDLNYSGLWNLTILAGPLKVRIFCSVDA